MGGIMIVENLSFSNCLLILVKLTVCMRLLLSMSEVVTVQLISAFVFPT